MDSMFGRGMWISWLPALTRHSGTAMLDARSAWKAHLKNVKRGRR